MGFNSDQRKISFEFNVSTFNIDYSVAGGRGGKGDYATYDGRDGRDGTYKEETKAVNL